MTSLSETYGGRGRSEVGPRRLSLGVGLFVGGTLLLVAGLLTAAEVILSGSFSSGVARRYGGILGGLGAPLVMLGIMTVLPANRTTRGAAVVGAAIMALGVALFAHAYPHQWVGGPSPELTDLTLPTAGIYLLGAATTLWCLFVGVANFKTRNDPGGTVTMEVTHKGETKVIEVERDQIDGLGGVGFLGGTPDGNVETQTNRPGDSAEGQSQPIESAPATGSAPARKPASATESSRSRGTSSTGSSTHPPAGTSPSGLSDGGSTTPEITSPMDDADPTTSTGSTASGPLPRDGPGDTYCGNCVRFDYVRTDDGMRPYCGHHDELMDDMAACDDWTPR